MKRARALPALGLLAVLALPFAASAAQPGHLERALQKERQKADDRKGAVQKLAERERELAGQLGQIEGRMRAAEERIQKKQTALDEAQRQEQRFSTQYEAIRDEHDKAVEQLRRILRALWPVRVQAMQEGLRLSDSWDAADRRFQWNSAAYSRARAVLDDVRRQERAIAGVLAKQRAVEAEVDKQLTAVNADKDALLRDRLSVNARMNQVSSQRRDLEGELQSILKTIRQLNYQLVSQRSRKFESFKASLPWPVAGRVVAGYAPGAKTPRRGIGLAALEGGTVRSVFWGKVVHNDILRGLGRVVIIYHGNDYYSLYAYLGDATVQTGQEVEKDETIGHVGYYPEAHGSGLYFELRFHQKPINPLMWLMPAQ